MSGHLVLSWRSETTCAVGRRVVATVAEAASLEADLRDQCPSLVFHRGQRTPEAWWPEVLPRADEDVEACHARD